MKHLALSLCLLVAAFAVGQSQYQNPTYIPNVQGALTSFTAAGDYYQPCNGAGEFSISVTGTFTGLTAAVRSTNDLVPAGGLGSTLNWVATGVIQQGLFPAPRLTSISAAGIYRGSCSGATGINLHITALSTGTAKVRVVATSGTPFAVVAGNMSGDPCADVNVPKSTAVINVGAATTVAIVPISGTTKIYPCAFIFTLAGTTPTFVFKSGTLTTNPCDTGTVSETGIFAPVSGSVLSFQPETIAMPPTAAGAALCGTTVGAGSSAQGSLVYVQQ